MSTMDVTERERLTHDLQRREAYLAEAQKLSHTGSFGWKVSTGEIIWSEDTFRIFEFDRTTRLTVDLILQRVHPEDVASVKQSIERVALGAENVDIEHRLLMPDGSVKYVHVLGHPLNDKSSGVEFVGAVIDITTAKEAEDRVRQNQEELRRIIDTIPAYITTALADGYTDFISQGYQADMGVSTEEWLGWGWTNLTHPEDVERAVKSWRAHLATGEPIEEPLRLRKANGEYRWFLGRSVPLRDEKGKIIKWYCVLHDIEDLKRSEDRLLKALDEIKKLKDQLCRENIALREEIDRASMFEEIVGASPALKAVLVRVAKVAPTDSTVFALNFFNTTSLAGVAVWTPTDWVTLAGGVFDPNSQANNFATDAFDSVNLYGAAVFSYRVGGLPGQFMPQFNWTNKPKIDLGSPFGPLSQTQIPQAIGVLLGSPPTEGLPINFKPESWTTIANFSQYLFVMEDSAAITQKLKSGQPLNGIGVFGRMGYAPPETNAVTLDGSVALFAHGLFDCRKYDSFGVGFYYNAISDKLKDSIKQLTAGTATVKDEKGIEIFYDLAITPAIRLIPDYQHIWDPLIAQVSKNQSGADVFLLRLNVAF